MKRLGVIGLFFITALLGALEWPLPNIVLTATFGESRGGYYFNGLELGGGVQPVSPIMAGETVFWSEEGMSPFDLPSGLGSFTVLEHERGLRSLYGHLKKGSMVKDKTIFLKEDVIAITGDTGNSLGTHLHLAVYDREFNQIVNPLLILPPLRDTRKPVIESVQLSSNNIVFPLSNDSDLSPGIYEILVHTYDLSEYVRYFCPMAVFSLDLFINGELLIKITHEALKESGKDLVLVQSPAFAHTSYYKAPFVVKPGTITLTPGEVRLEVVVRDFAENETVKTFQFTVRER